MKYSAIEENDVCKHTNSAKDECDSTKSTELVS